MLTVAGGFFKISQWAWREHKDRMRLKSRVVIQDRSTCAFDWKTHQKGPKGPGGDRRFCAVKVTNGTERMIKGIRIKTVLTFDEGERPGRPGRHTIENSIVSFTQDSERKFVDCPMDLEMGDFVYLVLANYDEANEPQHIYILKDLKGVRIELQPGWWTCVTTVCDSTGKDLITEAFRVKIQKACPVFNQVKHGWWRKTFLDGPEEKPPQLPPMSGTYNNAW